jgi:hypothetical protein
MVVSPYKLQIFIPHDVRKALRTAAIREEMSLQKLVTQWLIERLQEEPEGKTLVLTEEDASS